MNTTSRSSNPHASPWQKLANLPRAVGGHSLISSNNKLFVAGGSYFSNDEKRFSKTIYSYDEGNDEWNIISNSSNHTIPAYTTPVNVGKTNESNDSLLIGGLLQNAGNLSALKISSTGNITELPWQLPHERIYAAGAAFDGEVVLTGGATSGSDLSTILSDTIAINPNDGTIRQLPSAPTEASCLAACTANDSTLFIFGGATWRSGNVTNKRESFAFGVKTERWKALSCYPIPVRGAAAVLLDPQTIYIAGGYDDDLNNFTDAAYFYHIREDRFEPAPPIPYSAMAGITRCGNLIYCVGGEDRAKHRSNAAYKISINGLITHGFAKA